MLTTSDAATVCWLQDCWAQSPLARPSMDEVVTRLEHIQLSGEMSALDKAEPKCGCTIC